MRSAIAPICALAAAVVLAGCGPVERIAFQRDAAHPIRTIAILPVEEPKEFPVITIGDPNRDIPSDSEQFARAMKSNNMTWGPFTTQMLQNELSKRGYEVFILAGQSPLVKDNEKADYSQIKTDADVILDGAIVVIGYFKYCKAFDLFRCSFGYIPWLRYTARLVSAKDGAILYFQIFNYGRKYERDDVENLSYDRKYIYESFDSLMMGSDEAAEGLKHGIRSVAARIAEQLK